MAKMLFTVTEDWAFWSHRLPTAYAARDAGYEVVVAARMDKHQEEIERLGFRTIPWAIKRESMNPFSELTALIDLIRIYREERPDACYHVAIKSIIYGSIAARAAGVKTVFNLFSGLGVVFISNSIKFRLVRAFVTPLLRWVMSPRGTRMQVHNDDDRVRLNAVGISTPEKTDWVPGSGQNMDKFPFTPDPDTTPVKAVCIARMLWDKGVGELVEAARILRARDVPIRVVLVGAPDHANPATITERELQSWNDEGVVDWLGRRSDIPEILAQSHIAVLPSYREGLPLSLLEAGSTGRPLVAFDTPGCRDLVRDGENGFLVPFKDADALADALERLTLDKSLRERFGAQARVVVEDNYSAAAIRKQLAAIFSRVFPS